MDNYIALSNTFQDDNHLQQTIVSAINYLHYQTNVKKKNLMSLKKNLEANEKIEFHCPETESQEPTITHRLYKHIARKLHPDKCPNMNHSETFKSLRKDANIVELLYFSHYTGITIDLHEDEINDARTKLKSIQEEIQKNMSDPLFNWDNLDSEQQANVINSLRT